MMHRLGNGIRLVCDPVPGFETLALSVVAGRGARWEAADQNGWSHLLEHMVFKGAGPRDARAIVEDIEAAGGQINAVTGYERTSYQVRALAGGLPLGLEIIADLIRRPTLDPEELRREKKVVGQEIAEADDTPDDAVFEAAQAAAFTDQALGRPVLGALATLKPARPADLEAWRARLYAPDRLVVSIAGAVDPDAALRRVEALLGDMPAPEIPEPAPAQFIGGYRARTRRLEQSHLVFLLPAPGSRDPDYFAFRLLAEILGGGMSSRLFQEARERLGLAYAIDAYAETYKDTGVMGVYAGCAGADSGKLAVLVAHEIRKLAEGVTPTELNRSKAQLKAGLFMARESLTARAEQAAGQVLLFGRLLATAEIAAAIDAVSAEDLAALARRLLSSGRAVASTLGPKSGAAAADLFGEALANG
jgi:predicted Zn-dependent peptidase